MTIFENYAEHFEERMRDILLRYEDDPKVCHEKMDELMCKVLEYFGCRGGVEIFRDYERRNGNIFSQKGE